MSLLLYIPSFLKVDFRVFLKKRGEKKKRRYTES